MNLPKDIYRELKAIAGANGILTTSSELASYSFDATTDCQGLPDVVVFPVSTKQASDIMRVANRECIPVTVRGAGTNVSGGSVPTSGGIVMCTTRMNRILEINKANLTVTAEPGVVLNDLNIALAEYGLFFPPDPQSFLAATIGGCAAENSGGPCAVKYGVFKHYLLGMTVVLASGDAISLGGNTLKNVTGYDLPQLICGSEGTLAVITGLTLRVLPTPPDRQTVLAVFDDVVTAGQGVQKILASGALPAKMELMDNWVIRRIEETMPLGLPIEAEAILLLELDGIQEAVVKETKQVADICINSGAHMVRPAADKDEADKFWLARRSGFSAIFSHAPTVMAEDVTVPTDKIPDMISRIRETGKKNDLTIVIIGHAGDGNLHPSILTDKNNTEHYAIARKAMHDIFAHAIKLGGAISGEHGIGTEKRKFLKDAMPPEAIDLLKKIKQVFDPKGILNPGKIWE